jgi:two-component system alkaline phosphatase synthesis response regulator PhoP
VCSAAWTARRYTIRIVASKPAVLVVDDNDMMRKLLSLELSTDGRFHVESAATGAEGLAKAISSRCSVIVLDMMLPDFDGLQFIERLRVARPDDLPSIIAITGAPTTLVPDSMIEAPYRGLVSAVFRKPFDHAKLRETVAFCAGA